jgi:hypothetical protein
MDFMLQDMWVAMQVAYLSYVTNMTYICKRLMKLRYKLEKHTKFKVNEIMDIEISKVKLSLCFF